MAKNYLVQCATTLEPIILWECKTYINMAVSWTFSAGEQLVLIAGKTI